MDTFVKRGQRLSVLSLVWFHNCIDLKPINLFCKHNLLYRDINLQSVLLQNQLLLGFKLGLFKKINYVQLTIR